ncbi:hypothetical protein L1887_59997 [Cichorium endivia]|nr:hypothetical protein L1887_59997 [Cichorium endivia]
MIRTRRSGRANGVNFQVQLSRVSADIHLIRIRYSCSFRCCFRCCQRDRKITSFREENENDQQNVRRLRTCRPIQVSLISRGICVGIYTGEKIGLKECGAASCRCTGEDGDDCDRRDRDIREHEELTADYLFNLNKSAVCKCSLEKCRSRDQQKDAELDDSDRDHLSEPVKSDYDLHSELV